MAKQPVERAAEVSQQKDEIRSLAERLFIENWRPGGTGIEPSSFAAMCFKGALTFGRVASRIGEGQSPDEIIQQPETVTTAI